MLYEFHVQAVGSIHIAEKDNRKIALHVVLHLNKLLLVGSRIRGVSDCKVLLELLFDGDARGCVRLSRRAGQKLIYPKMADAEKLFNASAKPG